MEKKNRILFKNTAMLYVLQFSTYLFSFITVPYQTRVLGTVIYGVLGVAVSWMAYFQLFMDFGFLLSATEDISINREDRTYVSKRLTSIACIKAAFAVISFLLMTVLILTVPLFSAYKSLYLIYLAAYAANSFLPDYFFRGIERMTEVTLRTVAVKLFSCVMTFVFLKRPEDYLVVPILLLLGNLGAVIWAYFYIFHSLKYRFERVSFAEILGDLKHSAYFFLSRIASTVYTATNTIILGFVDKVGVTAGLYSSADKVTAMAKSGFTPISDSIYPYMIKNRNFKLIKKILLILEPVIIGGCAIVFIFAKPLCVFAFGTDFAGTAPALRAFLPAIAAILPSYLLGFPTLGAMGKPNAANNSIFFGTGVHLIGLVTLLATGNLHYITLAAMTSVSEWAILLYRAAAVFKYRRIFEEER